MGGDIMRTLRLSLVGTVIVVLLGGTFVTVVAQEPTVATGPESTWVTFVSEECGELPGVHVGTDGLGDGFHWVRGYWGGVRDDLQRPSCQRHHDRGLQRRLRRVALRHLGHPEQIAGPDGTWSGWYHGMAGANETRVDLVPRHDRKRRIRGARLFIWDLTRLWASGGSSGFGLIYEGNAPPMAEFVMPSPAGWTRPHQASSTRARRQPVRRCRHPQRVAGPHHAKQRPVPRGAGLLVYAGVVAGGGRRHPHPRGPSGPAYGPVRDPPRTRPSSTLNETVAATLDRIRALRLLRPVLGPWPHTGEREARTHGPCPGRRDRPSHWRTRPAHRGETNDERMAALGGALLLGLALAAPARREQARSAVAEATWSSVSRSDGCPVLLVEEGTLRRNVQRSASKGRSGTDKARLQQGVLGGQGVASRHLDARLLEDRHGFANHTLAPAVSCAATPWPGHRRPTISSVPPVGPV